MYAPHAGTLPARALSDRRPGVCTPRRRSPGTRYGRYSVLRHWQRSFYCIHVLRSHYAILKGEGPPNGGFRGGNPGVNGVAGTDLQRQRSLFCSLPQKPASALLRPKRPLTLRRFFVHYERALQVYPLE